jgi:hypothetical protein
MSWPQGWPWESRDQVQLPIVQVLTHGLRDGRKVHQFACLPAVY